MLFGEIPVERGPVGARRQPEHGNEFDHEAVLPLFLISHRRSAGPCASPVLGAETVSTEEIGPEPILRRTPGRVFMLSVDY